MPVLDLDIAWAINVAHSWPASLPDRPLQDGYSETLPNNLLRTQMDKGPAKVRRRTTANTRPIACRFVLTSEQVDIFESFYFGDCASGAIRFDWVNPRTGAAKEFRFTGEPPKISAMSGSDWLVTFSLEQMP